MFENGHQALQVSDPRPSSDAYLALLSVTININMAILNTITNGLVHIRKGSVDSHHSFMDPLDSMGFNMIMETTCVAISICR